MALRIVKGHAVGAEIDPEFGVAKDRIAEDRVPEGFWAVKVADDDPVSRVEGDDVAGAGRSRRSCYSRRRQ